MLPRPELDPPSDSCFSADFVLRVPKSSRTLGSSDLRFGLKGAAFFGGVFDSTFSCNLLEELCVGRIIRSRNPSAGFAVLVRVFGCSVCVDNGREVRDGLFRVVIELDAENFGAVKDGFVVRADGLRATFEPGMLARLGDREGGAPPILAADAAVGAVSEDGRRTGCVGDLGRGLETAAGAFDAVGARFSNCALLVLCLTGGSPDDLRWLGGEIFDEACLEAPETFAGIVGVFGVGGVLGDVFAGTVVDEPVEDEGAFLLVEIVESFPEAFFALAVDGVATLPLARIESFLALAFGDLVTLDGERSS